MRWELGDEEELVSSDEVESVGDGYEVVKEDNYVVVREDVSKYPPLGYPILSELLNSFIKVREGRVCGRGYFVVEGGTTYFTPIPGATDVAIPAVIPREVLKELIRGAGYSIPYAEVVGYLRFVGRVRSPVLEVRDVELVKPPKVRTMEFSEYEGLVLDGIEVDSRLRYLYLLHPVSSPGVKLPKTPLPPGMHASYVSRYSSVIAWLINQYHPSRVIRRYFRLVSTSLRRFKGVKASIKSLKDLGEVDSVVKVPNIDEFLQSSPNLDFVVVIKECPRSRDSAKDLLSIKYSYDITNYLLTTRLASPYPIITSEVLKYVSECAEAVAKVVSKYEVPRVLIGKGKFLDLTQLGRPATILKLAQSIVRAGLRGDVELAIKEATNYLLNVVKVISEGVTSGKYFKEHPELLSDEALILKLIEDIEASKGCATVKDLREELRVRVKDLTLERLLDMILDSLTRKGYLMYLMKRGGRCYKVVP